MSDLPPVTGSLLGKTAVDINGATWLLGHDLKSPIAIIISTLEVLISHYEDDQDMAHMVHMLRGALAAANRQYNMVSDMLDLARLEQKQYELERQPVNLAELLRESLDAERYNLTTKQLKWELHLPENETLMLDADPELLRRVVSALVDNSIKFTVREDRLQVRARREGEMVQVVFSDNGRRIFPEFEKDILERAPQWDGRQAGSRTSVGMGLPFVNAVALAHGGTFTARSDEASGMTTFTLTLPASK
jgi:signal transduction histidine kinase